LKNKELSNAGHARWCLIVRPLGIILEYDKSKNNVVVDALSLLNHSEDKVLANQEENEASLENVNIEFINKFLKEKTFFKIEWDTYFFKVYITIRIFFVCQLFLKLRYILMLLNTSYNPKKNVFNLFFQYRTSTKFSGLYCCFWLSFFATNKSEFF